MRKFFIGSVVLGLLLGVGCSSAPKRPDASTDRQCGRFCAELDRCLGDSYDVEMKDRLCELARCESGCRSNARAPAGYQGAFQFDRSTWHGECGPIFAQTGRENCRPEKARNNLCCAAICAAKIISREGMRRWPSCGRS